MRVIAVVLVLGIVAAGCGGEDDVRTGATASAPAESSVDAPRESATDEAPPPEATDTPFLTVGGTGLPDGAPVAAAGEGAQICVGHWNNPRNAESRRVVAGASANGAFVRIGWDGKRACVVWVVREDGAEAYVETADGAFTGLGGGGGLTAPPEWSLAPDGMLRERVDPLPPAATITGRTTVTAGYGSYCWTTGSSSLCADSGAPACGDGSTPRVLLERGGELRIELPFEPVETPVLSVFDGPEPAQHRLDVSSTPVWRADLAEGRHPISVFVRTADGNDVSYTACVDMERGAVAEKEPHIPPQGSQTWVHGLGGDEAPLATVAGQPVNTGEPPPAPVADADDCAARWNGGANAAAREHALQRAPRAAFVRLEWGGGPACVVYVTFAGDQGVSWVRVWVEAAASVFVGMGKGNGMREPPDWTIDDDGTLKRPQLTAEPPAATIRSPWAEITAATGSYCWSADGEGACVDMETPACGDGRTPTLPVERGADLVFGLPFAPAEPPVLTIGPGAGRQVELAAEQAPAWPVDLMPGRHAVWLFAQPEGGGDVSYAACLEVMR